MIRKPNFFIIGAAKSGTTTLWEILKVHPEIFMPNDEIFKEPAFFCSYGGMKDEERYFNIFARALNCHELIGEASTAYLTCPDSAKLIYNYSVKNNIKPKLIAILRNPVLRAYSLYNWNVQEGYEHASSFETALSLENKRMNGKYGFLGKPGGYKYNSYYYNSGLYYHQIQNYLKYFDPQDIHIEIFEDFIKDMNNALEKIYNFLNVDLVQLPDLQYTNPSYSIYSPKIQFFLRKIVKISERIKLLHKENGKTQRDKLLSLGIKHQKPERISSGTYKELMKKYLPEIKNLEKLLDRDLSIWYNKEFISEN